LHISRLRKYGEDWRLFWTFPERPASSVWEEMKGRLVELAPPEVSAGLIAYHRLLKALLVYEDEDPSGLNVPVFEEYIAELLQAGIIVDRRVQAEIRAYDQKYGEQLLDELPDRTLYP
jgi:hypothetical protein